jgi:hypothetical protein
MKLVTLARCSSIVGAIVWVLGLPVVAIYSVPFTSDATYLLFGVVVALLGLAAVPIALAYPFTSSGPLISMISGLGVLACVALVVSGALLIGGSTGLLGDKASSWITEAPVAGVIAFFVWVLLVSVFTRRSTTLGPWVFWLGILAGASVLVPILISALLFLLDPTFIATDATIPLDLLLTLMTWWCLPIWLIALAVKMRTAHNDPGKLVDTPSTIEATGHPSTATLS